MTRKSKCGVAFISFLLIFFTSSASSIANSFPFRAVSPGSKVPDIAVSEFQSNKKVHFAQYQGHPFLAFFWGADLPVKERHSIKALKEIETLKPFFAKRQIPVLAINVQGDDDATIQKVIGKAGYNMPVYLDADRTAYGELGIFVMPAFLLVDKNGIIVSGLGYSRNFLPAVKGEISILLGEETRAQVEHELHPEMIEQSAEEKKASRHLQMAKVMSKRGMPGAALREYQAALRVKPKMAAALVGLGCLYLDEGKPAEAREALDKGLALDPDSLPGQICQARIEVSQGNLDEALQDLQALMLRNSRSPDLRYTLGTVYEKMGKNEQAAAEYKKAYDLLEKSFMMQ